MTDDKSYRRNHYVPVWYQRRFLLPQLTEQKFKYLDLNPEAITDADGRKHMKTALRRWGSTLIDVTLRANPRAPAAVKPLSGPATVPNGCSQG